MCKMRCFDSPLEKKPLKWYVWDTDGLELFVLKKYIVKYLSSHFFK